MHDTIYPYRVQNQKGKEEGEAWEKLVNMNMLLAVYFYDSI